MNEAISQGADILRDIFGPSYPIEDLCEYLDYGMDINEASKCRELQYAQLIVALAEHYGPHMLDGISQQSLINIRADLFAGKLDAFIYQGQ